MSLVSKFKPSLLGGPGPDTGTFFVSFQHGKDQYKQFDPRLLEDLEELEKLFEECDGWPVNMYSNSGKGLFWSK
ncbi:unnamed protein product [Allacma fusca]|uniref:Uncharacterized protein n=1 Tax=Allacma fusca TaxID=39272 RepID=A0A8J2Q6C4_9HEXA|nr:unnamed protein product [Allacma fusca]